MAVFLLRASVFAMCKRYLLLCIYWLECACNCSVTVYVLWPNLQPDMLYLKLVTCFKAGWPGSKPVGLYNPKWVDQICRVADSVIQPVLKRLIVPFQNHVSFRLTGFITGQSTSNPVSCLQSRLVFANQVVTYSCIQAFAYFLQLTIVCVRVYGYVFVEQGTLLPCSFLPLFVYCCWW